MSLVAHLSCKAITVKANFCRKCGKALTEHNTAVLDRDQLPEDLVHGIEEHAEVGTYENLEDLPKLEES